MSSTFKLTEDKARIRTFINNVRQEVANIQSGEGKWRPGPGLHFEVGKSVPIFATLNRFEEQHTKKTYDAFIAQASQDLGKSTGEGFAVWGQGLFTAVTKEGTEVKVDRAFAVKLKDCMYDCFRVARIPLEPKQIEALELATARMAVVFQTEIHKEMASQLNDIVKKLKDTDTRGTTATLGSDTYDTDSEEPKHTEPFTVRIVGTEDTVEVVDTSSVSASGYND